MKLQDILSQDCTLCAVPASSKKRILEKISAIAATKISEISQQELLDSLMQREKLGSTGIGNGIAIPHGRLSKSNQVVAVLMTTDHAIAFDAIDQRPVDIFIALFVPESLCKEHLSTLQSIAKLFSDKSIAKEIRKCTSDQQLFQLVSAYANDK
jgi:PTS system nitrogen regulatory IIA component